jgi:hypothetical protein
MDGSNRGGDTPSLEVLERVEAACRRFESAWRRGEGPSIAEAASSATGSERSVLLRELVLLDLDYRRRRGEAPIVDDYRRLLPADAADLDAIFVLPGATACAVAHGAGPVGRPGEDGGRRAGDRDPRRLLGTTIGSARLLHLLGTGGAGDVYAAVESASVHGLVALKLVAPGGDHGAVLRRLEEERTRLDETRHPSIARLLSAGLTADGLAHFVSEHVPGEPITRHCDRHRLSIRERLGLFLEVVQAIHLAHEKGLVHGGLRPSNVLVALSSGLPLPRVTDLGVARATRPLARERAASAGVGRVRGHPEYTSPEEAANPDREPDRRADVHSLGLILYEILTGKLPFSRRELRRSAYAEVLRVIREREPPRPSERLGSRTSLDRAAALRRVRPSALLRELRDDLDWVVMMAIDKDPERRYPTARALQDDIERYLRDEPVVARRPGLVYRAGKLARRVAARWRRR